jgi:hypothetical protein
MGRSKVALTFAAKRISAKRKSSSASVGTNKAAVQLDPNQAIIAPVLQNHQELLRELHDLLTAYAPPWYAEDLQTRLTQALAMVFPSRNREKQRDFTIKKI